MGPSSGIHWWYSLRNLYQLLTKRRPRSVLIKLPVDNKYICSKIKLKNYFFCVLPDDLSPMSTTLATIPVRTIARVIFTNPGLDCVGNTIFTRASTISIPQVFTITRRACWISMGLWAFVCVILGQRFQIDAVSDTSGGATKLPCTLRKKNILTVLRLYSCHHSYSSLK